MKKLFCIIMFLPIFLCLWPNKLIYSKDIAIKTKNAQVLYLVKKGDSWNRIAGKFIILPEHLVEINDRTLESKLYPGMILKIPQIKWPPYKARASWYGPGFYWKKTASGEVYNPKDIFVAHREYPFGMPLRITNLENGKILVALVKDRGPYVDQQNRHIDLSYKAAEELGVVLEKGIIRIHIEPLL